ncbi:hypothetical protein BASA81_000715 [Batrachochytrium salamandrivorans]|nr:hypothetical protein BASA81_000715 [Batrachochytrium salamandrivorans]
MTSKSLRVFGVVLPLASDDLFFPGAMGVVWKSVLVCGLGVCLGFFSSPLNNDDCHVPGVVFLSTALGYNLVQLVLYSALVHVSVQGSILHWRERNTKTHRLLPAIALSYLVQLGLASFGVFASTVGENCHLPPVVLVATVVQWLDVGLFVVLLVVLHRFFQPHSPPPSPSVKQMETKLRGAFTWLTCMTCGILGTMKTTSKDKDHDREAIIISLRGTLSFADLVTDLMVNPTSLEELGKIWGFNGNDHYAHSDQEAASVIEMFDVDTPPPQGRNLTSQSQYSLIVLGHSLGGGVGAILTLLLLGEFPHCQCLAYDPPGCIFSREMAEISQGFCKTIVCGVDMVPRLSWHSAKRFRTQLLDVLLRSKTSKAKIMTSLFVKYEPKDLLFAKGTVPEQEERQKFEETMKQLNQMHSNESLLLDKIQMYIPGRVLHLAKTATIMHTCCHKRKIYVPNWIPERSDLAHVQVSKYMLFNHFPDFIEWAIRTNLKELMREVKHEARTNGDGDGVRMASHNPKLQV